MKNKIKQIIFDLLFYILGSFVYSFAIVCVMAPAHISPGGVSGIASVLNFLFSLPIGITAFVLNIPLIIISFIKFGTVFIARTATATAISSLLLDLVSAFVPKVNLEGILAAIFGGMLLGLGLSIVLIRGATTGGTDIAAKLINSRFPHISVGRCVLISDLVVITLTAFVYGNIESALYSAVGLYVSSKIMDSVLYGADGGKMIFAVSDRPRDVAKSIMSETGRGVTLLNATGAYTGKEKEMLMCAVRRHEVARVHKIINSTDKDAFIMICEAGEILGEGFKK